MDTGPLWLLDFDGVVNAVNTLATKPDRNVWPTWTRYEFGDDTRNYPILIADAVVAFIAAAHTAGVDIVWLTTWVEWTEQFHTKISGMPKLPYTAGGLTSAQVDKQAGAPEWWKHTVARNVSRHRPLVWADDDLVRWYPDLRDAHAWAAARAHTHIVGPVASTGMTRKDLRGIHNFLTDHQVNLPTLNDMVSPPLPNTEKGGGVRVR